MNVNHNAATRKHNLPGLEHQTLAGRRDGLNNFEIWRQTIDAGAATPVHRHACEEVIVVLKGQGVCRCGDAREPLLLRGAGNTPLLAGLWLLYHSISAVGQRKSDDTFSI